MTVPYGYLTKDGYFGRLFNGKWMMFATENEYIEWLDEHFKEVQQ